MRIILILLVCSVLCSCAALTALKSFVGGGASHSVSTDVALAGGDNNKGLSNISNDNDHDFGNKGAVHITYGNSWDVIAVISILLVFIIIYAIIRKRYF